MGFVHVARRAGRLRADGSGTGAPEVTDPHPEGLDSVPEVSNGTGICLGTLAKGQSWFTRAGRSGFLAVLVAFSLASLSHDGVRT